MALAALIEKLALAVRRDDEDFARVAGSHIERALRINGQRPDIFCLGLEEDALVAVGSHLIDLAVRRRSDVKIVRGIKCNRLRRELRGFEHGGWFARIVESQDLGIGAAGRVKLTVRVQTQRPHIGEIWVGEGIEFRGRAKSSVAADGDAFGGAFLELGKIRLAPVTRVFRACGNRQQDRDGQQAHQIRSLHHQPEAPFGAGAHFTVIVSMRWPAITWCISTDHSPAVDCNRSLAFPGFCRWSRTLMAESGTFGISLSSTSMVGVD